jgi:alpha-D-xyloside xylohydrolase
MVMPISRRSALAAGTASAALSVHGTAFAARLPRGSTADLVMPLAGGVLQVAALSDRAFRVRFAPEGKGTEMPPNDILAQVPVLASASPAE